MGFAWPLVLIALLAVPALLGWYVWQERRRRRRAVRHSNVALVRAALPRRPGWRRHLPFALLLAALAVLGLAAARPQVRVEVPVSSAAMIIALDVSGSMCATDVAPNRLGAAQAAVREFVEAQEENTSIGLVLFSGSAQVAVAPTTEREPLMRAIDGLTTGRGTTIGSAILKSVDAISEIDPQVAPSSAPATARPPGTYAPEIVVLLTDGANTRGVEPEEAAKTAVDRGVRIYTIGFGTRNPTAMACTAAQLGGSAFERFDPMRATGRSYLIADEESLRHVADVTGGEYFAADDAERLQEVLAELPRQVQSQPRDVEVSVWLVGLAALLLVAGVGAAARWTPFPS